MQTNKKLLIIYSLLLILFSFFTFSNSPVFAQKTGNKEKKVDNNNKTGHMVIAFGGGLFKTFNEIGNVLGVGGNAKMFFLYNKIAKGFGIESEIGYNYIPDKELENSFVGILPFVVSPLYMFETKYIDFQLKAGLGFAYVSGYVDGSSVSSSVDLTISAGFSMSHVFNNGFYLGLDTKYYYIFETKGANCLSASAMFGYSF